MKILGLFINVLVLLSISYSQVLIPNIAIFGGPIGGAYITNINDLNHELAKSDIPELPKSHFLLGGGGFLDLPTKKHNFIRIGGLGLGFTTDKSIKVNDTLSKTVEFSMGLGGINLDYVKTFKNFDLTIGTLLGAGRLKINIYRFNPNPHNWLGMWNEFRLNTQSLNTARNLRSYFYFVQPQIGLGLFIPKFTYLRLNAGYIFSMHSKWKIDDDIEVVNVPKGIKTKGFIINLGVNLGLFLRE